MRAAAVADAAAIRPAARAAREVAAHGRQRVPGRRDDSSGCIAVPSRYIVVCLTDCASVSSSSNCVMSSKHSRNASV